MPDNFVRAFSPDHCIDGDTIVAVSADLGYHVEATDITYRVARINCPEKSGATKPAGLAAKAYTEQWLIEHMPHGGLFAESTKTDDWRRYLAEITCGQGHNLSDDLLTSGHAVLYRPKG